MLAPCFCAAQRNQVLPDRKFYAALIATAGMAGRLDYACLLLTNMSAEGIPPTMSTCSALVHAAVKQVSPCPCVSICLLQVVGRRQQGVLGVALVAQVSACKHRIVLIPTLHCMPRTKHTQPIQTQLKAG